MRSISNLEIFLIVMLKHRNNAFIVLNLLLCFLLKVTVGNFINETSTFATTFAQLS